jgi:hypothetical protein
VYCDDTNGDGDTTTDDVIACGEGFTVLVDTPCDDAAGQYLCNPQNCCMEQAQTGPAIDCSNVPDTAPCHVMELIDAVRDAAFLSDIEPSVFCPCKRVRDNAPDANPETVASCNGGGP